MDPHRNVEQIEIIEHFIQEGRRVTDGFGDLRPLSTVRTTRENFELKDDDLINRRYELTGERDVSREASFLHSSAANAMLDSSPPRVGGAYGGGALGGVNVHNYGYDVHEVHTNDGGARIVETHGAGLDRSGHSGLGLDRSGGAEERLESTRIEESHTQYRSGGDYRPGVSSALRSSGKDMGFTQRSTTSLPRYTVRDTAPAPLATAESWRQLSDESFVRKDSYKRMQASQDISGAGLAGAGLGAGAALAGSRMETSRSYAPQSQTSLVSRCVRTADEGGKEHGGWTSTKMFFLNLYDTLRTSPCTPALLAHLCCILLLFLIVLVLLGIILSALFNRYSVREFLLYPPVCEECRRKNPSLQSAALPSGVYVHYYSANQAHLELRGNQPFKSNSFTAVDFYTGYVAFADHALTDVHGVHTTCFLMPLDRTALPDMETLMDALDHSDYEIQAQFGWQEFWQFEAEAIDTSLVRNKFSSEIKDCANAKWYLLKQTVQTRDSACSDCYDFCLSDYAVVRKHKYEDESTLGIRRLDCFRLYVPEWRQFSVRPDASGGHWTYPLSSQSTTRNENGEWAHWLPTPQAQPSY